MLSALHAYSCLECSIITAPPPHHHHHQRTSNNTLHTLINHDMCRNMAHSFQYEYFTLMFRPLTVFLLRYESIETIEQDKSKYNGNNSIGELLCSRKVFIELIVTLFRFTLKNTSNRMDNKILSKILF